MRFPHNLHFYRRGHGDVIKDIETLTHILFKTFKITPSHFALTLQGAGGAPKLCGYT